MTKLRAIIKTGSEIETDPPGLDLDRAVFWCDGECYEGRYPKEVGYWIRGLSEHIPLHTALGNYARRYRMIASIFAPAKEQP